MRNASSHTQNSAHVPHTLYPAQPSAPAAPALTHFPLTRSPYAIHSHTSSTLTYAAPQTCTSFIRVVPLRDTHSRAHTHTAATPAGSCPQLLCRERAVSVGPPVSPAAQTSGSFSLLRQRKAACPGAAAGGAAQHCGLVPPGEHPTQPATGRRALYPPRPHSHPHQNKNRSPSYAHVSLSGSTSSQLHSLAHCRDTGCPQPPLPSAPWVPPRVPSTAFSAFWWFPDP